MLYVAACEGRLEDVKFCLDCGMDPSIKTNYLWAPLHWAAHNGRTECVRELLRAGADPSPISDQSKTPLDLISNMQDREQIRKMLLDAGAKTTQEIMDLKTTREILDLKTQERILQRTQLLRTPRTVEDEGYDTGSREDRFHGADRRHDTDESPSSSDSDVSQTSSRHGLLRARNRRRFWSESY